jgi:ABC-type sugar transport system ATPase subunit
MTLAENIRFALYKWPREKQDQRINELLTQTNIIHCADRLPDQVSGGEAKRCGLARALAPRNPILLLDEPLANLDLGLRAKMIELIQNYHDETGGCIVYVTHHPDESDILNGREIVMEKGRIVQ